MKVVADTNVYVSAIIFGGKPQAILELAQGGQIELCISDDILGETTRHGARHMGSRDGRPRDDASFETSSIAPRRNCGLT